MVADPVGEWYGLKAIWARKKGIDDAVTQCLEGPGEKHVAFVWLPVLGCFRMCALPVGAHWLSVSSRELTTEEPSGHR